jgi:phosphoribosylformylglycinamidine synthase
MLLIPGAAALSGFRIAKLLSQLAAQVPGVSRLEAWFVHFVDVERPLIERERAVLERLLTYGPGRGRGAGAAGGSLLLIVPREGTVSPWSSKATDIARVCGLEAVRRIERGVAYGLQAAGSLQSDELLKLAPPLLDRMTEMVLLDLGEAERLFTRARPRRLERIALAGGARALEEANHALGLALSREEVEYLLATFHRLGRDPSDAELMMFAQANSEHSRHKIFNAAWVIDGREQEESLFAMIRNTTARSPRGVLSAYRDNAAVIEGALGARYFPDPRTRIYGSHQEPIDILMKVETHNHPTAISPFPGAATGSGGEIRDEGAAGRGAHPKAGLTGFSVSHLRIPGFEQPWEGDFSHPQRMASALEIMLDGPIGAASFNNEFGRPAVCGYFRTFEQRAAGDPPERVRGYHKPIMIAGGLGNIRRQHIEKLEAPVGAKLVVLGGPAMLIGLGGGAASSQGSGTSSAELDFASVQRGNAEMQRRAQEVIDRCWELGERNPIALIHDVGAGGLSNAVPEIVAQSQRGARVDLRAIPSAEPGMSPMELWCNEAQERYVLLIDAPSLETFAAIAERERCPFAVIGELDSTGELRVSDALFEDDPVALPLDAIIGKTPRMRRDVRSLAPQRRAFSTEQLDLHEAAYRVLRFPAVADKTFLITIGDRTVGGLISRDPLVGPWQVPVSDVAVTLADHHGYCGEAMAMGERTPVAVLDAPASGRLAVAEAITNILAAGIDRLSDIRLSANWMAACGEPGEDAALYATVKAVGKELCPALGIAIPVGKDSLSMMTSWREGGITRSVVSPVSLIVSAFAPVKDVRAALTPELLLDARPSSLWLIDLGGGHNRLGGSALAQVYGELGDTPPDLDDPLPLVHFATALAQLRSAGLILAYHDRSDGGLFVTLLEMAFAGHCGLEIALPAARGPAPAQLFAEELGVVVQIPADLEPRFLAILGQHGLAEAALYLGAPTADLRIRMKVGDAVLDEPWGELRRAWSLTSWHMRRLRDDPGCADEELSAQTAEKDPGLSVNLMFDPEEDIAAPWIARGARPAIAILRDQGVNSQIETAAVFDRAGFTAHDVHMTDLRSGRCSLREFKGLVACGGFSYGDVLGAGEGWAKSILLHEAVRAELERFFLRSDTFALGICNGCQMFAALKEIIPGTEHWPRFVRNRSEQYEARLALVEVLSSPSVLLDGMAGSVLPIAVAHGEGHAEFVSQQAAQTCARSGLIGFRYVRHDGSVADTYPFNPSGSPFAIAALCNADGRVTITMPHPERSFRYVQHSWRPRDAGEHSGWMRLFRNARRFVG